MSGREQRAALEYARSQGWREPEPGGHGFVGSARELRLNIELLEGERDHLRGRSDEFEARLAAEVESHAVTKRALLRGAMRARVRALEAALRQALWAANEIDVGGMSDEVRKAIAGAEALLEP